MSIRQGYASWRTEAPRTTSSTVTYAVPNLESTSICQDNSK